MRILHTADWHLGKDWNGEERTEDLIGHVIPEIIDIAKNEQVELVIVAGDILDGFGRDSLKHCAKIFRQPIKDLLESGIDVAMIPGNHDNWPLFRVLDSVLDINPFSESGQFIIFTEPRVHDLEKLQIVGIPYLGAQNLASLITSQGLPFPVEPELQTKALATQYERILSELKKRLDFKRPAVLIGHFSVGGTKTAIDEDSGYPGYETSYARDLRLSQEALLNSDHLPQYNALGHIHLGQQVQDTVAPTYYSGSPDRFDLGEENYRPHVLIVELPTVGVPAVKKAYIKSATPFIKEVVSSIEQLENIAKKHDEKIRSRVLGKILVEVEDKTEFVSIRDAAYEFFPRLKKTRTVTHHSPQDDREIKVGPDSDYAKFANPRLMFDAYFQQFPEDKIPSLNEAIDMILSELQHDN